ncbi:stalk domain-containing protein [Paenibacillus humicola]|uniref:stalk domain-containing protein n=1 Tax=Paenibacillus humicola TaxID=3110540 RepID=UPI00237B4C53|nr:stalk domain-containing protein [Paenibacillus humicola]
MKKKFWLASGIAALMFVSAGAGALAATKFTIIVNGRVANVDAKVINGSTYLPLRAVGQLLGADIGYNASTHTVTVTSAAPTAITGPKTIPVNATVTSGPMVMKISKITLDPAYKSGNFSNPIKAVIFDATVQNTSGDKVAWVPGYGTIVTNAKEQITGTSSDFSSTFQAKAVESGKIVFQVNGDLDAVRSLIYSVTRAGKVLDNGTLDYYSNNAKTSVTIHL